MQNGINKRGFYHSLNVLNEYWILKGYQTNLMKIRLNYQKSAKKMINRRTLTLYVLLPVHTTYQSIPNNSHYYGSAQEGVIANIVIW